MTKPSLNDLSSRARTQWTTLLANTSPTVVAKVADIISEYKADLAGQFYDAMLADSETAFFLSHETISNQLHAAMQKWLQELFQITDLTQITAAIAHQRCVGEVHARIHLPIHLVARGITILRQGIYAVLAASDMDRTDLIQAANYVTTLTTLAFELMSAAFMCSTDSAVRSEEAYRLFSLGQDIHVERERQRAMLMEWAHMTFSTLYRSPRHALLPLGKSEFGLWFYHKGQVMFEGAHEVSRLNASINMIDETFLPS
jgi:diguanylate cyclase